MKYLVFALGLCMAVCGSSAKAAFVSSGVSTVGGRSVQFAVWQNDGPSAAAISGLSSSPIVAAGSYAYLYQVLYPASPNVGNFRVLANPSYVASAGVIASQAFASPTTFAADFTLRPTTYLGTFANGVRFDITPPVNSNTNNASLDKQSQLMYVVSTYGPGAGQVRLAGGDGNGNNVVNFASAPVPVPLPPAIALMMLGLPMVGLIRRKLSK